MSESREITASRSVDLAGAVTVTATLVALVYALVQATEAGFYSFQRLFLFGSSLLLLATFTVIESRFQAPAMTDLDP